MKKIFESILLSILMSITVLLGLSFWLNIKFGFNLFNEQHWQELSRLQAAHTPINTTFYISIGFAIFVFILGLYLIYRPRFRNIFKKTYAVSQIHPIQQTKTDAPEIKNGQIVETMPFVSRPPRLNLPKNIGEIAEHKYNQQNIIQKPADPKRFDNELSEIFSTNNYVVKKNPTISGLTTNLFAIGANEIVWLGYVDCDIDKFKENIQKLSNVFIETLDDIPITIRSFLIDTNNKYESDGDILVFRNIEELKEYISKNPGNKIAESERDNFDAYSEYIDTIIQYIKNV